MKENTNHNGVDTTQLNMHFLKLGIPFSHVWCTYKIKNLGPFSHMKQKVLDRYKQFKVVSMKEQGHF